MEFTSSLILQSFLIALSSLLPTSNLSTVFWRRKIGRERLVLSLEGSKELLLQIYKQTSDPKEILM